MLKEENTKALINEEDTIDISMPQIARKRVRFDGDNNRVVYIDPSDMGIINRLQEALPKLKEFTMDVYNKVDSEGDSNTVQRLKEVDDKMRELIDYIFDAPVSIAAVPRGAMYNLHNGVFNFEHIIEVMATQYENSFESEFKQLNARLKNYTGKYTGKGKGKRK